MKKFDEIYKKIIKENFNAFGEIDDVVVLFGKKFSDEYNKIISKVIDCKLKDTEQSVIHNLIKKQNFSQEQLKQLRKLFYNYKEQSIEENEFEQAIFYYLMTKYIDNNIEQLQNLKK